MNSIRNSLFVLCLSLTFISFSQRPGGGRPPGGGPEQMIAREKEAVYSKITDLTEDQKMLLDGIYAEFATTLQETIKELRESNDRENRRKKMQALRTEKDGLIVDVLNEEQYKIYETLSRPRREQREKKDNQ